MIFPEYLKDPGPELEVQFLDSLVPTLPAGTYTLSAHQSLTDSKKQAVDGGKYLPTKETPVTQSVEVRAPRFTVEPEWVHGTYPPPQSTGLYSDVLAHMTLNRPTLPWERTQYAPGDVTRLPWTALLLFGEGELKNDPYCLDQSDPRTVRQLSDASAMDPDDKDVRLPAFDPASPIPTEDLDTVCRTIRVARATFEALAPTAEELPYLVHVRLVNEQHQKATRDLDLIEVGDYAVVTANRLPSAEGGRYVAHLVSLEGWTLPGGTGQDTTDERDLRLISLWSSAFETLPDHSPGFAALTQHFVDQQGPDGNGLLLQLPTDALPALGAEQTEVEQRLAGGYVPLACRTEQGIATFGWYRGPLIPVEPADRADRDRRRCAAEALIHLEEYGIFDVSYSAAFTAGRGAALADHDFCAALLRLRTKAHQHAAGADGAAGRRGRGGEAGRVEQLVASGLGAAFARRPPAKRPVRHRGAAAVTPSPLAPQLPWVAGLSAGKVRRDAAVRRRLTAALAPLTGTGPAGAQEAEEAEEDLAAVEKWLGELVNLERVPFAHLIADSRMLPPESLRFFHVDPEWVDNLIEGALSVGLAHDFDLTVDDLFFGPDGLVPLPRPQQPCGLLIRSRLASGWPALDIRAYPNAHTTAAEKPLPLLRREHLADDVLLVLIEGVPSRVEITEPQQGVHFGIDEPADSTESDPLKGGIIRLRSLKSSDLGQETGQQLPATGQGLTGYVRGGADDAHRVLSVAKLAADLGAELGTGRALKPAEFAIQMINAAQRRTFTTAHLEKKPTAGELAHV
ncbi:hypothetical protein ACFVTP_13115 [Streptomyces celluloflavus]|uniref:hypothetical protein n=1 Tax=Streptomyces celluloflavus TaxID=58344 RepID=UPI0036DB1DA4